MVEKQHSVDGTGEFQIGLRDNVDDDHSYALYLTPVGAMTRKGGRLLLHLIAVICVIVAMQLVFLTPTHCRAQEVNAATVQRSIDRGITYLRKSQRERGGWEEYTGQSCGASALCTLALLNAGVKRQDPDIIKAVRYIRADEPTQTYSVALQTLVFCQIGAAGDRPRIRRNVKWLVDAQVDAGSRSGGWGYSDNRGSGDPSNTQFALLALAAAQDRGFEIDPAVFERSLKYWEQRQNANGGWAYSSGAASGSMTCAGIASVIIARGRLSDGSSKIQGDDISCCGGDIKKKDPIVDGLDWLARSFSVRTNPGGHGGTFFYYMYALERVGRLSGRRFIGDHDWYREGAAKLIALQDNFQGFWSGGGWENNRVVSSSFALLFLSKGKRQVVIGQLQHGDDKSTSWQKHPDAMRQLVRHVERDWGRDLTWQTIKAKRATAKDLLQTPVLIISDNQALRFSDALKARLKEYIDQGGTILFEADGGNGCGDATAFQNSVKTLCTDWFDGVGLQRLPPTHPVWYAERKVDVSALSEGFWIYGVQACCRTAVFYSPEPLSCRWELSDILQKSNVGSKAVRLKLDTGVRIGQNIIAYATGRELKDKLEERVLLNGDEMAASSRSVVRMAMLGLDAGGNEAQRALPNASAIIRERSSLTLSAGKEPIGFSAQSLKDVAMLWIHGRTEFKLTNAQRDILRDYVNNDGVILGSAICGSKPFTESFRREMALVLPDAKLTPMRPDHPAFTDAFHGDDIRRVTIRTPRQDGAGQAISRRLSHPLIESAVVDDIASIFFSPLDLSCALESQNSVQCPGYGTDDAAKIVGNLILFALQQ